MFFVYDLEEVFADFDLEYGVSRTYGRSGENVLFTKLEDAWKAVEVWYEPFLSPSMAQRHPKIYIDTSGVIIDCYDDKDYTTETYSIKIIQRKVV